MENYNLRKIAACFRKVFGSLLYFLYPPVCFICGEYFHEKSRHICGVCKKKFKKADGSVENCFSAYVFDENLKKIMHSLKYQKLSSIGFEIGVVSAEEAGKDYFFPYDCIVPVPVHHTRLRERGYNQVLFIAEGLNSVSGKPVISVLARIRKTGSQTRLSKEERALNIRGAFAIRKKFRDYIKNKKILLIDDVYTTGATSDEARRILIENGSELVTVFTVCRA